MEQCNMIDQCLTIMYSQNSNSNESKSKNIAEANAYLTSLISLSNYELFKYLLINSSNLNAKYYSTNSLNQLITSNYLSISPSEIESLILNLYEILFTQNESLYDQCPYLLNGIIVLMCRGMRLCWISQSFYKTKELLMNIISKAKKGNLYQMFITFKICTELLCEYRNRDIPPIDKILRIQFEFKQECFELINVFCLECIALLLNNPIEKNSLNEFTLAMKEISLCLSECIDFVSTDSANISSTIINKSELKPIHISNNKSNENNSNKYKGTIINITIPSLAFLIKKLFFIYAELTKDNSAKEINHHHLEHILIILEKLMFFTFQYNNNDKEEILSQYQLNIYSIIERNPISIISCYFISKLLHSLMLYFPQERIAMYANIFSSLDILLKYALNNISTELHSIVNVLLFYSSFSQPHLIQNQSYINHCNNILKTILNSIALIAQYEESDFVALDYFITSFAKCGKMVYSDTMMHLSNLLDAPQSNTQRGLIIRLITKTLKYSYAITINNDSTAFIISKTYFESFNNINKQSIDEYYLNCVISFHKMLIEVFITKVDSKEIFNAFLTKYNPNAINQNEIVLNMISLLISTMNSINHQDNLFLCIKRTFKVINDSMRIQFDTINNTRSYYNGCLEISQTPFNQLVFKGIEIIAKGMTMKKDNKILLSIEVILFRLLLFINEHNIIINVVFDSINHNSFQSTNQNLNSLLDTITALVKSIRLSSDYEMIIDKLRDYFNSLCALFSLHSLPFITKNKILRLIKAITSNKQNIISFTHRQIEVPDLICKLVLSIITRYIEIVSMANTNNTLLEKYNFSLDRYNIQIYPISILVKIAKNILINSKSHLFKSAITEESFVSSLSSSIFQLYFTISKEEANSYLYKFKSIYEFAKIVYCNIKPCSKNNTDDIYLDKVIFLITEGIDSLDNIILITSHQIIFQLGKQCIEIGYKEIFIKYSSLFILMLKKLLCLVSKGDITSIHEVSSTILVLSIIYENEYVEIIKELSVAITNINGSQSFLSLFNGIEKNIKPYNIKNFKAKLKLFAQEGYQ